MATGVMLKPKPWSSARHLAFAVGSQGRVFGRDTPWTAEIMRSGISHIHVSRTQIWGQCRRCEVTGRTQLEIENLGMCEVRVTRPPTTDNPQSTKWKLDPGERCFMELGDSLHFLELQPLDDAASVPVTAGKEDVSAQQHQQPPPPKPVRLVSIAAWKLVALPSAAAARALWHTLRYQT